MSIRNRIIALLKDRLDGLGDDELAADLDLSRRQQANSRCRELAREGLVERRSVQGKIRNFWIGGNVRVPIAVPSSAQPVIGVGKPWCWEGNVVRAIATHLTTQGWTIDAVANTATGEPGVDVKASRSDLVLLVEVKGYPSKFYERGVNAGRPKKTTPPTQARHWLAEALLAALLRQSKEDRAQVAIAFPKFDVYTRLLARIDQSIRQLGLMVLLVTESGTVEVSIEGRLIPRP